MMHGSRIASGVWEPTPTYEAALAHVQKIDSTPKVFLEVARGEGLRGVFAINLLPAALAEKVANAFSATQRPWLGHKEVLSDGAMLWRIPQVAERRLAYELLRKHDLTFDGHWFDPEGYQPIGRVWYSLQGAAT